MKKGLSVVNPHAAGIDIADQEHWVAIHKEDSYHVSRYGTFTRDLDSMVSYLKDNGITTVAIEATGVYYVCLFIKLEEAGIEPYLVNAKHVKNVTGRKQDDTDAIWMQKLHACGLLQKSFQPGFECRTLRSYVRHRKNLVTIGSDSVRRMQKALELMNIKIHTVISDILGKTGQQMIEAIIGGQHDPAELIKYKDRRVKASDEVIIKSLEGIWKEEHLFELKQAYETYQFHQKQIQECDIKIKDQLDKQTAIVKEGEILNEQDKISFNKQKGGKGKGKKTAKKNQYTFDARSYLRKLLDTDICAVPGISDITALEVIAEIGGDVNAWARVNQFTRWLNVSPNTKSSGGKILSSKIMKKKNYAGLSLRMSAMTMARNKTPLGDYYRRMRGKLGGRGAVVATANKIARIIYTMIKHKKEYDISMFKEAQQNYKTRQIKFYEKKIAELKKAS
ncbi:MAG: IS110 family transposase [Vallitaleaceae bacterium]|nr:IS110 family transposase [Vallitaleaceae bacterium]